MTRVTLPDRVLSVDMPPIDALNTRMSELQARGQRPGVKRSLSID